MAMLAHAWMQLQAERSGASDRSWKNFSRSCANLAACGRLPTDLSLLASALPESEYRALEANIHHALQQSEEHGDEQVLFAIPVLGRPALARFLLHPLMQKRLQALMEKAGFSIPGQKVTFDGCLSLPVAMATDCQSVWAMAARGACHAEPLPDDPLLVTVLVGRRQGPGASINRERDALMSLPQKALEEWEVEVAELLQGLQAPAGVVSAPRPWDQAVVYAASWALESFFMAWQTCAAAARPSRLAPQVVRMRFSNVPGGMRVEGFAPGRQRCGSHLFPDLKQFWGYEMLIEKIEEAGFAVETPAEHASALASVH